MSPQNKPKSLKKQISHPTLGFRLVWNDAPKAPGGDAKVRRVWVLHSNSTAQHDTAQHDTAQHDTAQHRLCVTHGMASWTAWRAAFCPTRDHVTPRLCSWRAQSLFAKYEVMKNIGKGAFGTAVLLRHRRTGHMVVSKQVAVQEMTRDDLAKVLKPYA